MRRLGILGTLLLITLSFASPAFAQYPPEQPTCQVSKTVVSPGETVTVSGDNWQENSSVRVRFHQNKVAEEYGPFPTDDDGSFSGEITIPEDAQDGEARIAVGGPDQSGKRHQCNVTVTVDRDGNEPPTGTTCAVDDATPAPGQDVKVSGRQWQPKSTAEISFVQDGEKEHLATANVNNAGRFSKHVIIPEDAEPGPAQIVVEGTDRDGQPRTCTVNITVTPSSTAAGSTVATPFTPGALALIGGTAAVIVAGRRRRTRALVRATRRSISD